MPRSPECVPTDRAAKAREVAQRQAAARRAAKPAELSKALRTIREAVNIGALDPDDLLVEVAS